MYRIDFKLLIFFVLNISFKGIGYFIHKNYKIYIYIRELSKSIK